LYNISKTTLHKMRQTAIDEFAQRADVKKQCDNHNRK